jgi:hypothetical protein
LAQLFDFDDVERLSFQAIAISPPHLGVYSPHLLDKVIWCWLRGPEDCTSEASIALIGVWKNLKIRPHKALKLDVISSNPESAR